jgi:chromosome segregation ATPase
VEELENQNFKLLRSVDRVEKQLDETLRRIDAANEYTERVTNKLRTELINKQDKSALHLQNQCDKLQKEDALVQEDMSTIRKKHTDLEKKNDQEHAEISTKISTLSDSTNERFEDVGAEIHSLKTKDEELEEEDQRQNQELERLDEEVQRLDRDKVEYTTWMEELEKSRENVTLQFDRVDKDIAHAIAERNEMIKNVLKEMADADNAISKSLNDNCGRIDGELDATNQAMRDGFAKAADGRGFLRSDLTNKINTDIATLTDTMNKEFSSTHRDITAKDRAIHDRVDEQADKTELTFAGLQARMEEMVRVERARLGTVEREVFEGTAKLRSDFRAELERVRTDYEQNGAQIAEDLSDLHMKYDVTKQEINFFQARLVEQRDWQQRHLTETTTALRAAQVDSQEGLAAAQKMLNALRDDAVSFREKMAKYISLLQHSSDSQGDSLTALETHRSRMRLELDTLAGDHTSYTSDMDSWADDVRVKVERLFRALEPGRVEWRIHNAVQRLKVLKKPSAVKSPSFALKGVKDAQMELYPEGHNNAPPGKSTLRIFFPPGAFVRYQCWIGTASGGPLEFGNGGNVDITSNGLVLFADVFFDGWRNQVSEADGSIAIIMEVLRDHTLADEALTPEVHIESQ